MDCVRLLVVEVEGSFVEPAGYPRGEGALGIHRFLHPFEICDLEEVVSIMFILTA
jgi:hypothetical protein